MAVLRLSLAVLASVAALAATGSSINRAKKQSSLIKTSENDDTSVQLQQEEIEEYERDNFGNCKNESEQEEEDESTRSGCIKFEFPVHKEWNNVFKREHLKKAIRGMEQRRVTLEMKLLELYAFKEQQLDIAEVQMQLKAKTAETGRLNLTIDALQAELEKLCKEIKWNKSSEEQVEIAKKKILQLQAKIQVNAQLMMLKEQVDAFHKEDTSFRDAKVAKKLKAMRDTELEILEIKRKNKEVQLEKRELAVMLVAAQARMAALSNMTERKIIAKMEEEMSSLRLSNENLTEQVDRLQKNRFGMVDELVYQRWLNACMRIEVQSYQKKTQRKNSIGELSTSSSCESQQRIKDLTSHFSFDSTASLASSSESDKITRTATDSSSSSQSSAREKSSLIQCIKRWRRRDSSAVSSPGRSSVNRRRASLIRRFSKSMVPLNTSLPINKSDKAVQESDYPDFVRVRRVSFNDSVQTLASISREWNDEQPKGKDLNDSKAMSNSFESSTKLEGDEHEVCSLKFDVIETSGSSNLSRQGTNKERVEPKGVGKTGGVASAGVSNVPASDKKVGPLRVDLAAACLLCVLMLLVYLKALISSLQ